MVNRVTTWSVQGTRDWLAQRFSAILITAYLITIVSFILKHEPVSYMEWRPFMTSFWMRIFTTIMFVNAFVHSWLGIWRVTSDYIPKVIIRLPLQALIRLGLLVLMIWGIAVLWSI